MVCLRRIRRTGIGHQRLPGRAGFGAQFIEENLFGAFLQKQLVQRSIRRCGAELAIERHQASERLAGLVAISLRQGVDGLLERLAHARRLEHGLEFGRERRGLVVLHGDGAAQVLLAAVGQLGDTLGALRVAPRVGKLHAVAFRNRALVRRC